MSHFYGSIQGNRGEATKGGSKASGISGHIRGWNVGAKVYVSHNEETDTDTVSIYATSGSGGGGHDVIIAEFTADDLKVGAAKCHGCANLILNDQCAAHLCPVSCGDRRRERDS